jgi:hypothetical protein
MYANVDVSDMVLINPTETCNLLGEINSRLNSLFGRRHFEEITEIFNEKRWDVSQLHEAFRAMEDEPHLGIHIVAANPEAMVSVTTRKDIKLLESKVSTSGKYILAGGLGGLGKSIANLLVASGARNLVFLARSGAESIDRMAYLCQLRARGVSAEVVAVDICDRVSLEKAMGGLMSEDAEIAGVVQCAAVIEVRCDCCFLSQLMN